MASEKARHGHKRLVFVREKVQYEDEHAREAKQSTIRNHYNTKRKQRRADKWILHVTRSQSLYSDCIHVAIIESISGAHGGAFLLQSKT